MLAATRIYQVAVPTPLYRVFDYFASASLVAGTRVRVPFGRREMVGVVVGTLEHSELPRNRLKQVMRILDEAPLIPPTLLKLLQWVADYYHHPLGEVIHTALPVYLRQGRPVAFKGEIAWSLTDAGRGIRQEMS